MDGEDSDASIVFHIACGRLVPGCVFWGSLMNNVIMVLTVPIALRTSATEMRSFTTRLSLWPAQWTKASLGTSP